MFFLAPRDAAGKSSMMVAEFSGGMLPPRQPVTHIDLILNWVAEVKAKVPARWGQGATDKARHAQAVQETR